MSNSVHYISNGCFYYVERMEKVAFEMGEKLRFVGGGRNSGEIGHGGRKQGWPKSGPPDLYKLKAFAYPWKFHTTARSKLVKRVQRMLVKLRTQVRHIATRGDHRRAPVRSFLWLTKRM